jgi:hypothetical protein
VPGNFSQKDSRDEGPIATFLATDSVQRMYKYVDREHLYPLQCLLYHPNATTVEAFAHWFPALHGKYTELMKRLTKHDANLKPPSSFSCFAGTTFNLGPKTITVPHRDPANLATGLCMVVALGDFDSALGGHLVLHEPKAAFEMAEGDVVLFPSSVITHENIPITEHETRLSITAYTAGCLFTWADYDFIPINKLQERNPPRYEEHIEGGSKRWKDGWALYRRMPVS